MRKFNVYRDDDGLYKAVKKGWCWPAFFFGSVWALFSGLWLAAFLLLPIDFVFSIAGNRSNGAFDPYDRYDETTQLILLAIYSIPLAIRVLLGTFGNTWRARKIRKLGFSHLGIVKADGKEHAISICKANTNIGAQSAYSDRPTRPPNQMNAAPKDESTLLEETKIYSAASDEVPSYIVDSLLLIVAALIGIAACLSVVGLLPAGILLFGLIASLKSANLYYLKAVTRLVSGFGWAAMVISAAVGMMFLPGAMGSLANGSSTTAFGSHFPHGVSLAAFWFSGLSFAMICALRYLWLNPLLRQFQSIRKFVFGIRVPDVPRRPKVQKIMSRDGLQPYSVADEIAKWKALHDQGVIDDDEARQARRRLLNPT